MKIPKFLVNRGIKSVFPKFNHVALQCVAHLSLSEMTAEMLGEILGVSQENPVVNIAMRAFSGSTTRFTQDEIAEQIRALKAKGLVIAEYEVIGLARFGSTLLEQMMLPENSADLLSELELTDVYVALWDIVVAIKKRNDKLGAVKTFFTNLFPFKTSIS